MTEIKLTTSGSVTIFRDDGKADTMEQLLTRLRDAGVARDDVQAVLLLAGAVKSQARLLQRIDALTPLAAPRVKFETGRDVRNLGRGIGQAKRTKVLQLAETHGPRFKSARSLREYIHKQTGLTVGQVRQVLAPPKRKAPRTKPKPKPRNPR